MEGERVYFCGMEKKTTSPIFIYALHHPQSKHVYIGKTTKGMSRPEDHSRESHLQRYAHLPRSKWIQSLHSRGLRAQITVLEEFETPDKLDDAERAYIFVCKEAGISLLNMTDGGDGFTGEHSDEARAKMSVTRKLRVETIPGERERIAALSLSYWASEEAREKKRKERTGTTRSAETRAKISTSSKGKPKSPETRAKMAEAARLRCADPAWREKQREVQKIAQNRLEVRIKKSDASIHNWDSEEYREKNLAARLKDGGAK